MDKFCEIREDLLLTILKYNYIEGICINIEADIERVKSKMEEKQSQLNNVKVQLNDCVKSIEEYIKQMPDFTDNCMLRVGRKAFLETSDNIVITLAPKYFVQTGDLFKPIYPRSLPSRDLYKLITERLVAIASYSQERTA